MTETTKTIEERLAALETRAAHAIPCGRCSSLVDVTVLRDFGPKLMEKDGIRAVVCDSCVPYAKRRDWRVVKFDPAPDTAEPEPAKEAEASS